MIWPRYRSPRHQRRKLSGTIFGSIARQQAAMSKNVRHKKQNEIQVRTHFRLYFFRLRIALAALRQSASKSLWAGS
jgi:hypothetical protein